MRFLLNGKNRWRQHNSKTLNVKIIIFPGFFSQEMNKFFSNIDFSMKRPRLLVYLCKNSQDRAFVYQNPIITSFFRAMSAFTLFWKVEMPGRDGTGVYGQKSEFLLLHFQNLQYVLDHIESLCNRKLFNF